MDEQTHVLLLRHIHPYIHQIFFTSQAVPIWWLHTKKTKVSVHKTSSNSSVKPSDSRKKQKLAS